jgi:hypothetical protein
VSWYQLLDIQQEQAMEARRDKARIPSACPRDGEPLVPGPGNTLHCRYDGYQWPRDGRQV